MVTGIQSGERKLGILTVVDRVIQQAITQQLQPIFEPLFAEDSYGYHPKRSAQQAIRKMKEYAEKCCLQNRGRYTARRAAFANAGKYIPE